MTNRNQTVKKYFKFQAFYRCQAKFHKILYLVRLLFHYTQMPIWGLSMESENDPVGACLYHKIIHCRSLRFLYCVRVEWKVLDLTKKTQFFSKISNSPSNFIYFVQWCSSFATDIEKLLVTIKIDITFIYYLLFESNIFPVSHLFKLKNKKKSFVAKTGE